MSIISEDSIQKVREASDLVQVVSDYTPLKQRGHDFWGCCPLHHEKSASFKIDPTLQLWHCFGCGEGGDVFTFIMKTEDISYPDAIRRLADRAHITLEESGKRGLPTSKKARLTAACESAAAFYHHHLMRSPDDATAAARSYLASRGFGGTTPRTWQLGFAPGGGRLVRHLAAQGFSPEEMLQANLAVSGNGGLRDRFYNRIMFPIKNAQGSCIAFGGRVVKEGQPKYLNSQESPLFHKSEVLFGLDKAKSAMTSSGIAVVVEGYTDVIALHAAGLTNTVATLGTALTTQHLRMLARHAGHKVVYLFDGDEAGQRAADRALAFIDQFMTIEGSFQQMELCAATLPKSQDPAEFVSAQGADALRDLLVQAPSLVQYGIDRRMAHADLSRAEGRARALSEVLQVLAPIKESFMVVSYVRDVAGPLQYEEQYILDQLAKVKPPRRESSYRQSCADQGQPAAPKEDGAKVLLLESELNRRRFEREFLSLLAQHPSLAQHHVDALAQTQWHVEGYEQVAKALLDTLREYPTATASQLISKVSLKLPSAAKLLTASSLAPAEKGAPLADYLAEELALGDMEDAIQSLRARMKEAAKTGSEEVNMLFEVTTALQKDLTARRKAHVMPAR